MFDRLTVLLTIQKQLLDSECVKTGKYDLSEQTTNNNQTVSSTNVIFGDDNSE